MVFEAIEVSISEDENGLISVGFPSRMFVRTQTLAKVTYKAKLLLGVYSP